MNQSNNIFISRLPNNVTEFGIIKLLSNFGKITSFDFPVHKSGKEKGRTLGYCFVSYDNRIDALKAIDKLNNFKFCNTHLLAKWSKEKSEDDIELTFDYDDNIITTELQNETGIIDKDKLSIILEKSKKIPVEKKVIYDKSKINTHVKKDKLNPLKTYKDKLNQIRKIEEALKKYSHN